MGKEANPDCRRKSERQSQQREVKRACAHWQNAVSAAKGTPLPREHLPEPAGCKQGKAKVDQQQKNRNDRQRRNHGGDQQSALDPLLHSLPGTEAVLAAGLHLYWREK